MNIRGLFYGNEYFEHTVQMRKALVSYQENTLATRTIFMMGAGV